jgi:arsenite methyltransferase
MMTAFRRQFADYGLDAPGVVRNLVLAAAIGFVLWAVTVAGLWSGVNLGIPTGFPR